jgi:hypothetical protein
MHWAIGLRKYVVLPYRVAHAARHRFKVDLPSAPTMPLSDVIAVSTLRPPGPPRPPLVLQRGTEHMLLRVHNSGTSTGVWISKITV